MYIGDDRDSNLYSRYDNSHAIKKYALVIIFNYVYMYMLYCDNESIYILYTCYFKASIYIPRIAMYVTTRAMKESSRYHMLRSPCIN